MIRNACNGIVRLFVYTNDVESSSYQFK